MKRRYDKLMFLRGLQRHFVLPKEHSRKSTIKVVEDEHRK